MTRGRAGGGKRMLTEFLQRLRWYPLGADHLSFADFWDWEACWGVKSWESAGSCLWEEVAVPPFSTAQASESPFHKHSPQLSEDGSAHSKQGNEWSISSLGWSPDLAETKFLMVTSHRSHTLLLWGITWRINTDKADSSSPSLSVHQHADVSFPFHWTLGKQGSATKWSPFPTSKAHQSEKPVRLMME